MNLAITGASGFVGQAVVRRLRQIDFNGYVRLIDRDIAPQPDFECISMDLSTAHSPEAALDGVERVWHLAAFPGGASEADPTPSRRINMDLPLDLIDRMNGRRLIYASSIAVFGDQIRERVDDQTEAKPNSVYGTHKRMIELAFADAVRRKHLTGVALRLPGIVARPMSVAGFGSAFLTDVFHSVRSGQTITVPVSPDATSWLMSASCCADNLIHALLSDFTAVEAITLGMVRVRIDDFVMSAARYGDATGISYLEDPAIRRVFGSHATLNSQRSHDLGFRDDGSIHALVDNLIRDV